MVYINHKGDVVDTEKLSDKDLVLSHRWYRKYCKIIENISLDAEVDNKQYTEYVINMLEVRDALEAEIVSRKLKRSLF